MCIRVMVNRLIINSRQMFNIIYNKGSPIKLKYNP